MFSDLTHTTSQADVQAVTTKPLRAQTKVLFNTSLPLADQAIRSPQEKEFRLADGVTYYTREHNHNTEPSILWLVMTKDASSWGKRNKEHSARNFSSFLTLLASTQLNLSNVSLGLLTSCEEEYTLYKAATTVLEDLAKVTVILHPGYSGTNAQQNANRKDPAIQAARRSELAKLRNYLMLKSLRDETHIVWLDADVFEIDNGIVQTMIAHAEQRDDVGILTARCTYGTNENYDKNAWAGTRPPPADLELVNQFSAQLEREAPPRRLVDELIQGTMNGDLVPLTAVGGTILYIRASLVLQGLSFPHQYTVGTRWMRDGYDGLETEGLCYRARGMSASGCFLLGGHWHVRHMIN